MAIGWRLDHRDPCFVNLSHRREFRSEKIDPLAQPGTGMMAAMAQGWAAA